MGLISPLRSNAAANVDVHSFRDASRPSAWLSESYPRILTQSNNSQLSSQRMDMTAIYLNAGMTIANIIYCSADTPTNGPTHWWFALYDSSRNLLKQTADQTTTAWGANTLMSVALASTYAVTTSGLYYTAVMMQATVAVPTLVGMAYRSSAVDNVAPFPAQFADTGLGATAPNPHAAPTANSNVAWSAVS